MLSMNCGSGAAERQLMDESDEDRKTRGFTISWKTCLRGGVCTLVVFLCIHYWAGVENFLVLLLHGLGSILAGLVIAYVVNIPMRFFESKLPGKKGDGTLNRTLSMVLAIVCIVLIALFVVLFVVPRLATAIITVVKSIPGAIDTIASSELIASILPSDVIERLQNIDWQQIADNVVSWLKSGVMKSLPQITSMVGSILVWFMGVVFAFWYLSEKNRLGAQCHRLIRNYLGENADAKAVELVAVADDCFSHYVVGQALEALIYGTMIGVASALLGLPNPLILGLIVGVMSLIPMVGAILGAVLGAIIVLSVSWQQAIVFVIIFIVVMLIEGNLVYKHVVGKRVGLTGMWPLIGITLGAALFGMAGAFVGVPVTAIIFRIVRKDLKHREGKSDKKGPAGSVSAEGARSEDAPPPLEEATEASG